MSSTHRRADRMPDDYYVTNKETIEDFWQQFDIDTNIIAKMNAKDYWALDPAAGGSPYDPMAYPEVLNKSLKNRVVTIDIRKPSLAQIKGDFLRMKLNVKKKPFLVITNPPFMLATEFIDKSIEEADHGGYIVMLLRLNFFGSQKRSQWLKNNMPCFTYVHSKRPGFFPALPRKTDSTEYAHFVWIKNNQPKFTKLRVI